MTTPAPSALSPRPFSTPVRRELAGRTFPGTGGDRGDRLTKVAPNRPASWQTPGADTTQRRWPRRLSRNVAVNSVQTRVSRDHAQAQQVGQSPTLHLVDGNVPELLFARPEDMVERCGQDEPSVLADLPFELAGPPA